MIPYFVNYCFFMFLKEKAIFVLVCVPIFVVTRYQVWAIVSVG